MRSVVMEATGDLAHLSLRGRPRCKTEDGPSGTPTTSPAASWVGHRPECAQCTRTDKSRACSRFQRGPLGSGSQHDGVVLIAIDAMTHGHVPIQVSICCKIGARCFFASHGSPLQHIANMSQKASLQVGHDGVAVITLQNPPVNALHPAGVLQALCHVRRVSVSVTFLRHKVVS